MVYFGCGEDTEPEVGEWMFVGHSPPSELVGRMLCPPSELVGNEVEGWVAGELVQAYLTQGFEGKGTGVELVQALLTQECEGKMKEAAGMVVWAKGAWEVALVHGGRHVVARMGRLVV